MSEQQPECPEEFGWMKPGVKAIIDGRHKIEIFGSPYFLDLEWRIDIFFLDDNSGGPVFCGRLKKLPPTEAETLRARLAEAEARANAEAAKLARVKALLGTEIMDLALSNLADLLNFDDPQYILLWSGRREQMPALLLAISEVREVLQ